MGRAESRPASAGRGDLGAGVHRQRRQRPDDPAALLPPAGWPDPGFDAEDLPRRGARLPLPASRRVRRRRPLLPRLMRNTMTTTVDRSTGARSRFRLPPAGSFVAMAAAFAAFFIAAGAPTPLLPIYEAKWNFPASMVTVAFGVYAIALLLTLLIIGSLTHHIGRRPLLIGALALELVSMLVSSSRPRSAVSSRPASSRASRPPRPP